MYIWIGCQLPGSFEKELRSFCLAQNESLGLDTAAFALPQHISLKISFEALENFKVVNGKIVESWGYWPDREIENKLKS